jgi:hypothetical protein
LKNFFYFLYDSTEENFLRTPGQRKTVAVILFFAAAVCLLGALKDPKLLDQIVCLAAFFGALGAGAFTWLARNDAPRNRRKTDFA